MPIVGSGTVDFEDLQTEFGGSNPIALNEYYRSGSYVPANSINGGIPTSGTIQLDDFYGSDGIFIPAALTAADVVADPLNASCSMQLNTDGSFTMTGNSSSGGNWHVSPVAGRGNSYEVRLTQVSGSAPSSGPALATWHALTSARVWGMSRGIVGTRTGTFTLAIRQNSAASASHSRNITMTATVF